MATSNASLWNAAWAGPVVCVLVMVAVFFALWWAMRQLHHRTPSGEETETFMADTGANEDGRADAYVIANHKAEPDRTVSRVATKGKDRPTKLCDLREEIRHLQKQMLDAQPGAMIRVPDNKDTATDPTTEYTKYGLTFVWAQSASQSNDSGTPDVSADLEEDDWDDEEPDDTGDDTGDDDGEFDYKFFLSKLKKTLSNDRAFANKLLHKYEPTVPMKKIKELSDAKMFKALADIMCYEEE